MKNFYYLISGEFDTVLLRLPKAIDQMEWRTKMNPAVDLLVESFGGISARWRISLAENWYWTRPEWINVRYDWVSENFQKVDASS